MLIKALLLVLLVPNEDNFNYLKRKAYAFTDNPDSVIFYATKGKELAVVGSHIDSAGYYYYLFANEIAEAQSKKHNFREATNEYQAAIQNRTRFKDQLTLGYVYKGFGEQLESNGLYIKAVDAYEEARSIFEKFDNINLPGITNDLGVLYLQLFKFQKATHVLQVALDRTDEHLKRSDPSYDAYRHMLYVNKIYVTINLAICLAEQPTVANTTKDPLTLIRDAAAIANSSEFDPDEKKYLNNLLKINEAYIHFKAGRKNEMERVWKSLDSPDKDFEYYYVSGCYNKLFERPEDSFKDFRRTFQYCDSLKIFRPAFSAIEGSSAILTRVNLSSKEKDHYSDMYVRYRERMARINMSYDSLMDEKFKDIEDDTVKTDTTGDGNTGGGGGTVDQSMLYIISIPVLLIAVFAMFYFTRRRSKCKRFYNVESRTIDITGLNAGISEKFKLGVGSLKIDSKYSEATENLKKLDMIQYTLCQDIHQIEDKEERQKQLVKVIDVKTEMLKIISNLSNP